MGSASVWMGKAVMIPTASSAAEIGSSTPSSRNVFGMSGRPAAGGSAVGSVAGSPVICVVRVISFHQWPVAWQHPVRMNTVRMNTVRMNTVRMTLRT